MVFLVMLRLPQFFIIFSYLLTNLCDIILIVGEIDNGKDI